MPCVPCVVWVFSVCQGEDAEEDEDDGEPSEVVTLTTDNFSEMVGDDKDAMLEFYAPW